MGGVSIIPDCTLDEINYNNAAIIILPCGGMWENDPVMDMVPVVEKFLNRGIPVAAICGTTVFQPGMDLEGIEHTSNGEAYLQNLAGKYKGNDFYVNKPSVSDNGIITANGIASLEFARDVLGEFGIYDNNTLNLWYDFFKNPQLDE